MKNLKTFENFQTNEEINMKGIAAGALLALTTACNQGRVDGKSVEDYEGDMLVKKIEISDNNFFYVSGKDNDGNDIAFSTDKLTFNVGDSVHVDFNDSKVYPAGFSHDPGTFTDDDWERETAPEREILNKWKNYPER